MMNKQEILRPSNAIAFFYDGKLITITVGEIKTLLDLKKYIDRHDAFPVF